MHKIVLPERILENDCAQIEVPSAPAATGGLPRKLGMYLNHGMGRTSVQIGVIKAPEIASKDRRLQRTVERSSAKMCGQIGVIEVSMNSSQENFETVKMPQIAEETVGVVRWGLVQRERMQQRTVDAPMPQVLEETVEMVQVRSSHERVQQRTAAQLVDVAYSSNVWKRQLRW